MASTQTLARPYARAAFSVAREAGELPAWGEALEKLGEACADDRISALVRHPGVPDATCVELLAELASGPAAVKNLLGVLAENGKLTLLPAVGAEFASLKAAFEKMRHVAITSASEVSGDKQSAIVEALKKRLVAEVAGVEAGDMLKLRAGPGLGYEIIVGLPNGTLMRTGACNRVGGTVWCEAALDRDPGTKGYVSETYLRKL